MIPLPAHATTTSLLSSSSSSSSSSLPRFHRKPLSVASPPLSILSIFSFPSPSAAPSTTSTWPLQPGPASPSRKAAFKPLRISPYAISGHPFSTKTLLSSLSAYSLTPAFRRTPCLRSTLDQEVAFLDEGDEDEEIYDEEDDELDEEEDDELDEEEDDEMDEEKDVDSDYVGEAGEVVGGDGGLVRLSVKEKKELASYANSLGKKLKCQLVGKSGVTESVGRSFVETLEANELLKIKIHRTCPGELEDVVKRLEMLTGSVIVGQIGRTVIIYRPSITKMKAEEEKKKQARRIFSRRVPKSRFTPLKSKAMTRNNGHGRRGSSRAPV